MIRTTRNKNSWQYVSGILYIIFPKVCLYALTLHPATARLRCSDQYIRCHRLLAVKPLSPREHAGRRVRKGRTLGSVQTTAVGRGTDTASSDHLEPSDCRVAAKDNRSLHAVIHIKLTNISTLNQWTNTVRQALRKLFYNNNNNVMVWFILRHIVFFTVFLHNLISTVRVCSMHLLHVMSYKTVSVCQHNGVRRNTSAITAFT